MNGGALSDRQPRCTGVRRIAYAAVVRRSVSATIDGFDSNPVLRFCMCRVHLAFTEGRGSIHGGRVLERSPAVSRRVRR